MADDRLTSHALARSRWIEVKTAPGVSARASRRRAATNPAQTAPRGPGDAAETGPPPAWAAEVLQTFQELLGDAPGPASHPTGKEESMPVRVLIADDHAFIRGLIRGLLAPYADVQVVGEANDGQQAIDSAQTLLPDVIVMDVAMPRLNGIEATTRIARFRPHAKVIALSMYMSPQFVLDMARAGAYAYVIKDYAFEELYPAIQAAASGAPYVSERISRHVAQQFCDIAREHAPVAGAAGGGPGPAGEEPKR